MTADDLEFRCGSHARQRGDSLAGTAAPATSWLLVADPGPWARRAFEDSPLDPEAGSAIAARARDQGARPLFIRRHGRRRTPRRFAFVDAVARSVVWQDYESLAEVAAADWTPNRPLADPLFLVCTHGRHDRCCAIAGRPVARQFDHLRPQTSWECSHLGGDRFASNVLALPTGATYGFVDPLDVPALVAATEQGQVYPPLLRGYSTLSPPQQAARIAAQTESGRTGIDQLLVVGTEVIAPGRWRVQLADDQVQATVEVMQERVADARATCAHSHPVAMRELRVVALATRATSLGEPGPADIG